MEEIIKLEWEKRPVLTTNQLAASFKVNSKRITFFINLFMAFSKLNVFHSVRGEFFDVRFVEVKKELEELR